MFKEATRSATLALALPLLIGGFAGISPAAAQQAERCSGTLCDLYYRNDAPAPAVAPAPSKVAGVPAGATAVTVPSGNFFTGLFSHTDAQQPAAASAASAQAKSSSFVPGVHMGGGGIFGDHSQAQCEGTLCDLMGRSTPPRPEPSEQVATDGAPAAAAAATPATGSVNYASGKHYEPIQETPRCRNASDPWHCFR